MFDLEVQIKAWRAELAHSGIWNKGVVDELEVHLRQHFSELTASGLPEAEAFQGAKNRLGDGEILQREFSKVKRYRSRNWRDNPLALNLVGGWLVLMGLYHLSQIAWFAGMVSPWTSTSVEFTYVRRCFFAGLEILAGLGVFRRGRFWRYLAVAFLSYDCLLAGWVLIHIALNYSDLALNVARLHSPQGFFMFLGIPINLHVAWVMQLLELGLSLFGFYTLIRPSMRELFRPATLR